jgi:glycosyltransferase involved in cell wall biosynthesis
MTLPISVFIIAKNEEDRIHYGINSVRDWVDEVIVIDSGSTDNTVKVAKKLGAKVVYNVWKGYGQQKIFGEELCKNQWILNIDADEEISPMLAAEIKKLFAHGQPKHDAYYLNIKLMTIHSKRPSLFAPTTDAIRFYNSRVAGFRESTVHDSVILRKPNKGRIGRLHKPVYHRCFRSLTHAVEKINSYTSMQAADMRARKVLPSGLRIVFEPLVAFCKAYFLRRYCLYGVDGFVESIVYAFSRTLRLAKTRELAAQEKSKK